MNKRKSQFLYISIIVLIIVSILNCCSYILPRNSRGVEEIDDSYVISNYEYNAVVNENNTIDISEKITARFLYSTKHGIYRNIPVVSKVTINENGKQKDYFQRVEITNVKGNQNAVKSIDDENMIIRFGSEDKYQPVNQDVLFTLEYTINLGKDYAETFDMFYYSLIGPDWDTEIKKFNFSVTMPKDFDANNLKFYTGKYGSTEEFADYTVTNKVITGSISNVNPGNALTASLVLPQNYFSTAETITFESSKVIMYITISILALVVVLYLLRNKQDTLVSPVEFYAPDGMNPVEVGAIYNGNVTTQDISSLIVYFASKKYLKITVDENKHVILTKLKDINPKAKSYEKKLFDRLFVSGDTINLDTDFDKDADITYVDKNGETKVKDTKSIPMTIYECMVKASATKPVKRTYDIKNMVFAYFGLALLSIINFAYLVDYSRASTIAELMLLVVPLLTLAVSFMWATHMGVHKFKISHKIKVAETIVLLLYLANYIVTIVFGYKVISYTMGYTHYVVGTCMLLSALISGFTITYSSQQVKKLGRVLGFKNFLLTCEKDRLDLLVKDNPEYFFDVLPYTYVFDICDEFIDRFKYLCVDYNYHTSSFDVSDYIIVRTVLGSKVNKMSTDAIKAHRATTGGSSGGGFSGGGGGFSGGGFGGGGGGSW